MVKYLELGNVLPRDELTLIYIPCPDQSKCCRNEVGVHTFGARGRNAGTYAERRSPLPNTGIKKKHGEKPPN